MDPIPLKEALLFHNPWWQTGQIPVELLPEYERPILARLLGYLKLNRVLSVKGPRRTGKSTLLYQMMARLLKQGVPPYSICYASFDDIELRQTFDEIIKAFEQITHRLLGDAGTVYFFLDEIHYLPRWEFQVKKYFDKKRPVKFILSGSAATLVHRSAESLAGRTIEELVLPFSFAEFASLKLRDRKLDDVVAGLSGIGLDKLPDITDLLPYRRPLELLFAEYLAKGGFPHIFSIDEPLIWKKVLREDIIEKVIYRDLVELFGVKKPFVLEKLFLYLTGASSEILNISSLAAALGLSREYTEKYVEYLRLAYLVGKARKYAPSIKDQIRSMEKVYCIDSGLISAFGSSVEGKRIESLIYRHLYPLSPYYWRERYEVDFVIRGKTGVFPIESKYRSRIEKKDLAGLLDFMERFKVKQGIVVSKDTLEETRHNQREFLFIPAWLFLLLIGPEPDKFWSVD